jgi:integrase
MKLTDFAVARAKPPASGRIEIWDAMLPGFGLRISEKGTKSWVVMYRVRRNSAGLRRATLGRYPVLSLAKARERARRIFEAAFDGIDPAEAQPLAREQAPTFEKVAEQFIGRYAKPKNRGWKRQQADLAREFTPVWGKKPIDTINRRDLLDVLDRISDRSSPLRANRHLALIRKLFNWCLERGILETSPAANIKPPGREVSRDRVLSDDEIRSVWSCSDAVGHPFGPIFKLLLVTAQRREEVGRMRWADLDMGKGIWTIPRERSKNDVANEVPLSPLALAIIKELPRFEGEDLVFPASNGSGQPASGYSKAKLRLDRLIAARRISDELPAMPEWWVHDLRRTAASGMARLSVPPHVIERVLNHISGSQAGVAGIYNRYGYLPEKRKALEAWGRYVEELVRPATENVIQFAGVRS